MSEENSNEDPNKLTRKSIKVVCVLRDYGIKVGECVNKQCSPGRRMKRIAIGKGMNTKEGRLVVTCLANIVRQTDPGVK